MEAESLATIQHAATTVVDPRHVLSRRDVAVRVAYFQLGVAVTERMLVERELVPLRRRWIQI